MELWVVFDNRATNSAFKCGWGYSVFLRPYGLLFDTGSEPASLLHNLSLAGISLTELNTVFLSHFHWDHAGGLLGLLSRLEKPLKVVLHRGFSPRFAAEVARLGGEVVFLDEEGPFGEGLFTTGALEAPTPEAALILPAEGLLLTGCAHPGIRELVLLAGRLLGRPPSLVMGGFHLLNRPKKEVLSLAHELKALGVKRLAPSHCTGEKAERVLAEVFGDDFLWVGAGSRLLV